MNGRYDAEICISTDFGELEDVPAVVDYIADFVPADPTVGDFWATWDVRAEIFSANLSGLKLDRSQLVRATSEAETERQETIVAEIIQMELTNGDLAVVAAE